MRSSRAIPSSRLLRRRFLAGCCGCVALAAAPRAFSQQPYAMPPRIARPDPASDEGGWWAQMDREEQQLKRSGFLVRDPVLARYVSGIACRLAGEHCPDVRVYLVRTPIFNAMMAPNGMMQVWSGLLLRMTNEAQLAAVIGHEIGHYVARHSIERIRNAKSMTGFAQFLGIALTAAGAGGVGSVAQLALIAGFFSYTRDQEREADQIGLDLMTRAGYAPIEAARVWENLLEETKSGEQEGEEYWGRSILFATHPPAEERQKTLAEMAAVASGTGRSGAAEYRAVLAAHRAEFFADELKRRRFGETRVLLARLRAALPEDGEVQFWIGEAHRLRGQGEDLARALDAYRAAAPMPGTPPELYRSLGLVHRQLGQPQEAFAAFSRYLELRPGAADADLIRAYVKE
jgi:predicted Zn-dependent protease